MKKRQPATRSSIDGAGSARSGDATSGSAPSGSARSGPAPVWIVVFAMMVLRLVAPLVPGMWPWGVNALAHLPWWGWALSLGALVTLVPGPARHMARAVDSTCRRYQDSPALPWVLAVAAGLLVFLLPDRVYFVGDFFMRQMSVKLDAPPDLLFPQYLPLDLWLHYTLPVWIRQQLAVDPNLVNRIVGAVEASLLAGLAIMLSRRLGFRGLAALAASSTVFWGGWLSLYTGLAKGFSELVLAAAAVAVFGFALLRDGRGRIVLTVVVCLALLFHRAALALLPAALLALWWGGNLRSQVTATATATAKATAPWLRSVTLLLPLVTLAVLTPRLMKIFGSIDRGNFGLDGTGAGLGALVDPLRLLDLGNLILLLVPLAPLAIVLLFDRGAREPLARRQWIFVATLVSPFLLLMLVFRPPQGFFRDFDGLAVSGMVVAIVTAILIGGWIRSARKSSWPAVALVTATVLPAFLWLALHTQLDRALARIEALAMGPPLWSQEVRVHTLDFAASRRYEAGDYAGSAQVLSKAVELAPSPRLVAGWAQSSADAGDWVTAEKAYRLLLERAQPEQTHYRVIGHLGVASGAGRRGELDEARRHLQQAYAIDPEHPEVLRLLRVVEQQERAAAGSSAADAFDRGRDSPGARPRQ